MWRQNMAENGEKDRAIARLLKLVGERTGPRPEAYDRAYVSARAAWQRSVGEHAATRVATYRPFVWLAAAATVAAVAVIAIALLADPDTGVRPALDARVERVAGNVLLERPDGEMLKLTAGDSVTGGTVVTAGDGRVSLRLAGGYSVRLDNLTRLHLDSADRFTLASGGVYADSGSESVSPSPLSISTPAGDVHPVGTQYQVQVREGATRISVREGRVIVAASAQGSAQGESPANSSTTAGELKVSAGEELLVTRGGGISRRRIATHGSEWEWAASIGPPFEIENRMAADFLHWIAREQGWTLRFDSEQAQEAAVAAVLHGSVAGLSAEGALQRVCAITGLSCTVSDGVLVVGETGETVESPR